MNDMLQQLMNMIENARTIPALTDISMIGFAVLLVFGANDDRGMGRRDKLYSGVSSASVLDDALWIYHWSRSWIRSSLFQWCD